MCSSMMAGLMGKEHLVGGIASEEPGRSLIREEQTSGCSQVVLEAEEVLM
jgi:hypothetical protein